MPTKEHAGEVIEKQQGGFGKSTWHDAYHQRCGKSFAQVINIESKVFVTHCALDTRSFEVRYDFEFESHTTGIQGMLKLKESHASEHCTIEFP